MEAEKGSEVAKVIHILGAKPTVYFNYKIANVVQEKGRFQISDKEGVLSQEWFSTTTGREIDAPISGCYATVLSQIDAALLILGKKASLEVGNKIPKAVKEGAIALMSGSEGSVEGKGE